MRVLVTGGAGFVGSHIVDALVAAGHAVTVVDNLSTGRRANVHAAARLVVADIRGTALGPAVAAARPEAVVHAAAQGKVTRALADPGYDADVNLLGTIRVVQAAARARVGVIVYISTGGAAYGNTDHVPTPETEPARPVSPYGVSKIAAEGYVECLVPRDVTRPVCLRLANVYGPRQDPFGEGGVVAIFARRMLAGETCVINGDGAQTRDFVYVGDVAAAVRAALGSAEARGIVNVGTGVETSVADVYRRLAALTGATLPARHAPAIDGEQRRSALDAGCAAALLGWRPTTALDDGLARTVAALKAEAHP